MPATSGEPSICTLGWDRRQMGAPYDTLPSGGDSRRLLLLTGARLGEARNARFDQFNLEYAVWTKPAATTKQRKTHRLPLSCAAVAFVRARRVVVPRDCPSAIPRRYRRTADSGNPFECDARNRDARTHPAFTSENRCATNFIVKRLVFGPTVWSFSVSAAIWSLEKALLEGLPTLNRHCCCAFDHQNIATVTFRFSHHSVSTKARLLRGVGAHPVLRGYSARRL